MNNEQKKIENKNFGKEKNSSLFYFILFSSHPFRIITQTQFI